MTPRTWGGSLQSCMDKLNSYLKGWAAYYRICSGEGAAKMRVLDAHIRRRLRAYPNDWFHERMESLWMMWVRFNPPPLVSSESQMSFAF
jgi:hypothetical protein